MLNQIKDVIVKRGGSLNWFREHHPCQNSAVSRDYQTRNLQADVFWNDQLKKSAFFQLFSRHKPHSHPQAFLSILEYRRYREQPEGLRVPP
jgi:hypothetical protein